MVISQIIAAIGKFSIGSHSKVRDYAGSFHWPPLDLLLVSLSSYVPGRLTSLDCFAQTLLPPGCGWVWSMESTSRRMEHGPGSIFTRVLWMVIFLCEGYSSYQVTLLDSSSSLFWLP